VVTPGFFLRTADERVAPDALELVAWVEVLERVEDWELYQAAFPKAPGVGEAPGWSLGLAKSLRGVRGALQENAMTLAGAARRMEGTVETERWQALASLEGHVEKLLGRWGRTSRSKALAQGGWQVPDGFESVVLAGVADAPPAVVRVLRGLQVPVVSLIGAPEEECAAFDEIGRPVADVWNARVMPWPDGEGGSVAVAADPRQQAQEAVRLAARIGTPSDRLALGTADEETAGELVRAFGREGWVAHDPSRMVGSVVGRWFVVWRRFLSSPDLAGVVDLLGFRETEVLVGGGRARLARELSSLRDRWLCSTPEDLARMAPMIGISGDMEKLMAGLENWLGKFGREGFVGGMDALLAEFTRAGVDADDISEWLDGVRDVAERSAREAGFWLDVMAGDGFERAPGVPPDRVLDVQGWLELFHEPGPHLVLCGMNEGKVPGRADGDPWLSESARRVLGLSTDASRAARDAYLFTAMAEARKAEGRVDVLLGKSGLGGDTLLPSRLLLAAGAEELPGRVRILFRAVEPPDAGIAWVADWKWKPRDAEVPARIGVTAFGDYLACPFRYYLKHVLKMSQPEPERREWNARDFGNVLHVVLEKWGRDEEARGFSKSEAIEEWVCGELDRLIAERYGKTPSLALRIQAEGMKQRLAWFARKQACEAAEGWEIEQIESKFEMEIGGFVVAGRVDRVDRHRDGRRRVLDYKTRGKLEDVEKMHRTRITGATRWPAHLEGVDAVRCVALDDKGKPVEKRWENLQVALYSAAIGGVNELGYFGLGATEGDVGLRMWDGFGEGDRDSAMRCAEWVVSRVAEKAFWPPAGRTKYDDYEKLAMGRGLEDMIDWRGMGGVA
jgi:ATP-dependent helicase/nuclease subunit B